MLENVAFTAARDHAAPSVDQPDTHASDPSTVDICACCRAAASSAKKARRRALLAAAGVTADKVAHAAMGALRRAVLRAEDSEPSDETIALHFVTALVAIGVPREAEWCAWPSIIEGAMNSHWGSAGWATRAQRVHDLARDMWTKAGAQ